jgi:hypothetical protein
MTATPPRKPGRKTGSGNGPKTTRVDVHIRNDQLAFWDDLDNKSAFVQKAIDEAIKEKE